jgi:stress response protein YsnF
LLQEGEITLEETEEVPVVAKEAVVMQDIILVNGATERMETVQDMVRRTEVDVEDTRPSTSAMPA